MKILVTIDEVECFRLGFSATGEIELELDPAIFDDEERNYIAAYVKDGKFQSHSICPPDLDGFIDAVHRGIKMENGEIPF
jgi:hypothetical protein